MARQRNPWTSRARAAVILLGAAALVLSSVLALRVAARGTTPAAPPAPGSVIVTPPLPPPGAGPGGDGWDVAAEAALATRPMPVLPAAAALPHALNGATTEPALRLPAPRGRRGPVGRGFPPTPDGALAQLVALTRAGLAGGDPATYARAYAAVAGPGAPPAPTTPLYRGLDEIRSRAGLPATGPVDRLTFTWTPTSGLVKGVTDDGRFVVVCVLGQLDAGAGGRVASSGAGDCQGLRRVDGQWWIAPGPPAAPAPLAWPGSAEAAQVGYREVRDAG